jgi:hypothetical protein
VPPTLPSATTAAPPAAPAKPEPDPARVAAMVAPIAKTAEPPKLPDAAAPAEMKAAPADGKTGPAQPGAQTPEAMKPQVAKKQAKVIQKTKPTRRLKPGDLICGECGEGNPPARKFCSRCGTSLDAAKTVKKKWWQKLIPKRKVKTLEVGERPGVGGVKGKKARKPLGAVFRRTLGIVGIACTLLFTFVAPFRNWVQDNVFQPVKDKWNDITTQDFETVAVATTTANSEEPEFPARNAFDLVSNSVYHGPLRPDLSQIQITVTFQEPTDIDRALVTVGDVGSPGVYARPRNIHLVFDTGQTYDLELTDSPEGEVYEIDNAAGVSRIDIFVVDVYQSENQGAIAITEWEWKTET